MDGTDTILSGNSPDARKDWRESLEVVVARTGHERYRHLCDEANPDTAQRDGYRRLMVSQAAGEPVPEPAPTPEDLALRAYAERHGCGGCGSAHIPISE